VVRFKVTVLTALAAIFAIGCGGDAPLVKEGDHLEIIQNLDRERFEAAYGDLTNPVPLNVDGAHVELQVGTIVKVLVTPKDNKSRIEVIPVKIGDVTDDKELRSMVVPDRFTEYRQSRGDFLYYSFSFDPEYLGTKVKKVQN
jgi:hypothetical protein